MHEAAGAPPQLTDGACEAAQSTGAAASRPILQARPLALRLHRERAIVAKNTDLCAADLDGGRARRRDNRGPRMLARMRTHRASCSPGGGRPSSPPERPCPGSGITGGCFSVRPQVSRALWTVHSQRQRPCLENTSQCCCASGLSRFASSIGELRWRAGRFMHSSPASGRKRVFRPPVSSSLPEW